MSRIKKLTFMFSGLILFSLFLVWMKGTGKQQRDTVPALFQLIDPTQLTHIEVHSFKTKVILNKSGEQWLLNKKYKVDTALITLLGNIMSRVEVQRPVSTINLEEIKTDLITNGRKVTFRFSNASQQVFYAGGDGAKRVAYFADESLNNIYIVAIPGYKSYVSGIFELTIGQWRDRVLFSSSWRTLKKWRVDYADTKGLPLDIGFNGKFLSVGSVDQLDTAALMLYLQPLEDFQVNDYLEPGAFPRYDSLLKTLPLATITVDDIDSEKSNAYQVYPKIKGERFYLISNPAQDMIVVDAGRMEKLLTTPMDFKGD